MRYNNWHTASVHTKVLLPEQLDMVGKCIDKVTNSFLGKNFHIERQNFSRKHEYCRAWGKTQPQTILVFDPAWLGSALAPYESRARLEWEFSSVLGALTEDKPNPGCGANKTRASIVRPSRTGSATSSSLQFTSLHYSFTLCVCLGVSTIFHI